MTTKQHTCFTAHCDECKRDFELNGITMHYDTPGEAICMAEEYEWQQLTDGQLICEHCVSALLIRGEIEENPDDEDDAFAYRLVAASAAPTTA
jgi:hypothetical protein